MRHTFLFSIVFLSLSITPAQAHKLLVAAALEKEGVLKIEAFFPDGSPAQEIPVTIGPGDGRPPFSGRTDRQGTFRFYSLSPGPYRIIVGDLMGHRAETHVVIPGGPELVKTDPLPPATVLTPPSPPGATGSAASPGEPTPWGAILAGLALIFGLTALIMVLNLRKEVKQKGGRRASGN